MRNYLLFCSLLVCLSSRSQVIIHDANKKLLEVYDANGKSLALNAAGVGGTPMLSDNWGNGYVKLVNGRIMKDLALRFNVVSNELTYKVDSVEFAFVNPVIEFGLLYVEDGKNHSYLFRKGYPGKKPDSQYLFYEVLAEGKRYHLLKRNYKRVRDQYVYAAPPTKSFRMDSEMYLFDFQTQTLISIKPGGSLAKLMPAHADKIAFVSGDKNYRFHSEKELVRLFVKCDQ